MKKVIIQIPCYNEEHTLPHTLADLPREIPGIGFVEWLVIDDGSTDRTAEVAREHGVDHIVRHTCNRGLAHTFRTGMDASLRLGADIIVNTDADNQYPGADIPKLIEPIVQGSADFVIGDRQTWHISHFSLKKRVLQALGTLLVRKLSGTNVTDAVSGFRAFSREAALQLNIVSSFSYTIESIIQAGRKRMAIACVPIQINGKTRNSRLFRSIPEFLRKSGTTMLRVYAMYNPLRVFFWVSLILMMIGVAPILRFLWFYFTDGGQGHVQSLVLGGVCLMMGFLSLLIGLVADLIALNRQLLETVLEKVRQLEQQKSVHESKSLEPTFAGDVDRAPE